MMLQANLPLPETAEVAGSTQPHSTAINPEPPCQPQPVETESCGQAQPSQPAPADVARAERLTAQVVTASEGLLVSRLEVSIEPPFVQAAWSVNAHATVSVTADLMSSKHSSIYSWSPVVSHTV